MGIMNCIDCGKKIGFLNRGEFGRCNICSDIYSEKYRKQVEIDEKISTARRQQEATRVSSEIDSVVLTTEVASSLKIIRHVEIITAECAYGMNVFKDLFAGVRDVVGGRSEAVQKTMRDARRTVLYELKAEAHRLGANAVVGVDLDYVELSGAGNMVMLVASGTAVLIEPEVS